MTRAERYRRAEFTVPQREVPIFAGPKKRPIRGARHWVLFRLEEEARSLRQLVRTVRENARARR